MSDDIFVPPNPTPNNPTPPTPPVMETRDVLNNAGTVIGQLSLPQGTSEQVWFTTLAPYTFNGSLLSLDLINSISLAAVSPVTTSSGTASTIAGMTTIPPKGSYLIIFSGSVNTAGASANGEFGIYLDGGLLQATRRDISCNLQLLGGLVSISLNSIAVGTYTSGKVTVDGTQTIDVKFRSTNGGTIGFAERTMTLIKVS